MPAPLPPVLPATLAWGAEALWLDLSALLPGLSVEVVAEIGSTNTELLERARRASADGAAGDVLPCLLVAEHQSRGRGRQGKAWQSAVGASLTCSLALPLAPRSFSGLSLAVGLALAEALEPAPPASGPRVGLKWPNDLLLRGDDGVDRKLGGILIETVQVGAQRLVVVGTGLNIQPLPAEAASAASAPAPGQAALSWGYAPLQALLPGISAPQALARIAAPLLRALLAFERDGFAPLRARYALRDRLAGQPVSTTLAELPQGVADGVDDDGVLWLRVDGRRQPLVSGEVSVRRVAGAAPSC